MTRYAVRATPWLLVMVGCGVVAGLMALVAARPWNLWPLEGASVGVMGGVVAVAMDERCAGLVDTLPRGLRWRTAARAGAVVPIVLTLWACSLFTWRHRLPDHLWLFVLQGAGAVGLALAITGWRRATGTAEPGAPFAALVIPTATALALIRPWPHWVALFPVWPGDNWAFSRAIWSAASLGSPALLALAFTLRAGRRG
ncbi:hypothetical protein [Streptomyces sp. NPDC056165]|uniref:hypothetical protein n=1 Tax=Streptomyces sp. NPDC056165 TaxID=3345733 RepID=UPI0035E36B24